MWWVRTWLSELRQLGKLPSLLYMPTAQFTGALLTNGKYTILASKQSSIIFNVPSNCIVFDYAIIGVRSLNSYIALIALIVESKKPLSCQCVRKSLNFVQNQMNLYRLLLHLANDGVHPCIRGYF